MKMKTLFSKRRFLAALTAALLISAALIASCMNPLEEQQEDSKIEIPKGKGLVRINISGNGRSILPASLPSVGTLFYTVSITSASESVSETIPDPGEDAVAFSALNNKPIALPAATDYEIIITAWEGTDTLTANPIAGYEITGFEVNSGSSTALNANLTAFLDPAVVGSRSGTFTYSITVPALPGAPMFTVTTAPSAYIDHKIEIRDHSGALVVLQADGSTPIGTSGVINITIGANTGTITLVPGYYTVRVTLTAAKCQDRIVEQVLHIYSNKTSDWSSYTVPSLSQDLFSVAFNMGTETEDISSTADLTTQEDILNAGTVTDPGDPTAVSGKLFLGWFDGSTKWVFAGESNPTLVFKDKTLMAHWDESAGEGVTITIVFDSGPGDIPITPVFKANGSDVSTGITYADLMASGTITLTFTNQVGDPPPDNDYANVVWYMDNFPIGTGNTLVISKTNTDFMDKATIGNHVIEVKGEVYDSGVKIGAIGTLVLSDPETP